MLKGLEQHENKEQGESQHETPRIKHHKAIQNKNNTRTTALERSVSQTTVGLKDFYCWQFLIQKYMKSSVRIVAP